MPQSKISPMSSAQARRPSAADSPRQPAGPSRFTLRLTVHLRRAHPGQDDGARHALRKRPRQLGSGGSEVVRQGPRHRVFGGGPELEDVGRADLFQHLPDPCQLGLREPHRQHDIRPEPLLRHPRQPLCVRVERLEHLPVRRLEHRAVGRLPHLPLLQPLPGRPLPFPPPAPAPRPPARPQRRPPGAAARRRPPRGRRRHPLRQTRGASPTRTLAPGRPGGARASPPALERLVRPASPCVCSVPPPGLLRGGGGRDR